MKNATFLVIITFLIAMSLEIQAHIFENGDFEQPIEKRNANGSWSIQDAQALPGTYNGLVSRKYDLATDNYYLEIESHNSALRDCDGTHCNRGEILVNPSGFSGNARHIGEEGQRTKIYFKFKVDQIWDRGDDCRTCLATILQYLPSDEDAPYAVAPMMSLVLSRYRETNREPSISLQHKIDCRKPSNKANYQNICRGRDKVVLWGTETFIPVQLGVWYEAYSHVLWKEVNGTLSAGIRRISGRWQYFEKDGIRFHNLPTRAQDKRHRMKAGIYGYGGVAGGTNPKKLRILFDDFKGSSN